MCELIGEANVSSIRTEVREFLQTQLGRDVRSVTDQESLLEAGVLDSLGVMQLVTFLEERFKIKVSEDDMMPDNFDSLDAIAGFVDREGSGRAG